MAGAEAGSATRRDGIPPRIVPILYFALAHAALLTALAVAAFRPGEASGFYYQPRMVALVHLVTLGWITASILGSLYVIGPMALRTPMPAGRADGILWLLFAIGFSGVASHFWINAYGGVGWAALLALGAILHVGTRALLGIRSAPVQSAVKLCLLLANLNILLAGGFGILLAFDKAHPFLPARELGNVFAHAHLSAIGWVGMMVMGTGLRMLPMILPSAMPKTGHAVAGALVMELGVVGLFVALLFRNPAAGIFSLLIAAGFGIFLSQVGWMLRNRRPPPAGHPRPDLGVWHAVQALMYLVVALGLGMFLIFAPESELTYRLAPLYGVFGLLGFFGQLVLGVETRILPMFAAYYANRNACQVGPVIKPYQMTSRPLQWAVFLLWTAGIPLLAGGMSLSSASLVRSGASLLLCAASAMALNTVLVLRHAFPVPQAQAPGPLPSTPAAH
jgi:hypothetical protein